jgi:hypothetical protein
MKFPRPTTARINVSGDAAPDIVWQRYITPATWSSWSPQIRSVDYPHRTIRAGTAGVVHAIGGVRVPFRIEQVDPDERRWVWAVKPLGLSMRLVHTVEDQAAGSRTGLEVSGPPLVVHGYALASAVALHRLVTR